MKKKGIKSLIDHRKDKKLVFRRYSFVDFIRTRDEIIVETVRNKENKKGYVIGGIRLFYLNPSSDKKIKIRRMTFCCAYVGKKCVAELQKKVDEIKFEDGLIVRDSLHLPGRSVKIPKMSKNEAV